MLPKITIVTPSYNQAEYLEVCLKSVINQSYPNLEYIVMDGGSNDNSIDIIRKYDSQINYWQSQPDNGQASAIKRGFEIGSGEIIGWINSDDFLCSDTLFKVADIFSNNEELALIYGNAFWVDQMGSLIRALISTQVYYQTLAYGANTIFQGATFYKRQAYEEVGCLNTGLEYAMEYELLYKLAQRFTIQYIPEFFASFRKQPLSKGSTIPHIGQREIAHILEKQFNISMNSYTYRTKKEFFKCVRRIQQFLRGELGSMRKEYYQAHFVEKTQHIY
ncbi:glycosyltransferase [Nostoc sp. CCCryo 231-06]|nr:glycosyltransferase [Nostoc sp. CCCryo 231-06]